MMNKGLMRIKLGMVLDQRGVCVCVLFFFVWGVGLG